MLLLFSILLIYCGVTSLLFYKPKYMINLGLTIVIYVMALCYINDITYAYLNLFNVLNLIFLILLKYGEGNQYKSMIDNVLLYSIFYASGLLIILSSNLFFCLIGIELQTFTLYGLTGYSSNRKLLSSNSGLKYFLFGSLASSIYIIGLTFVYLCMGSTDIMEYSSYISFELSGFEYFLFLLGNSLLVFSIIFKIGMAPFHTWLINVYGECNKIVLLFLLILPKIPLLHMITMFIGYNSITNIVLMASTLISLVIGVIYSLWMSNNRLFVVYTTIVNNGFLVIPLLSKNITLTELTISFYLLFYTAFILIFLLITFFVLKLDNTSILNDFRDLIFMKKSNPVITLMILFGFLMATGIPPFLGFFAKLYIISILIVTNFYFFVFILLLSSMIIAFYYLRPIKVLYFYTPILIGVQNMPKPLNLLLCLFVLLNIDIIYVPHLMLNIF